MIPLAGSVKELGYTSEEWKMVYETRKILHDPEIRCTVTCVRVPVYVGHAVSANVRFHRAMSKAEAVEILVVDHERRPAGHGEEPGADIARHLARHGVHVEVRRLSSGGEEVGHLLLSQAAAFGADLLVMGAYGHSYVSEWMFGGVTRTVFHEAELPVLMSR